jgi:tetratricopeptide (TPR) repeat protein
MGDARKGQEFVTSLGDALVVNSGKFARPRTRVNAVAATAAVVFALAAAAATYYWYQSYKALKEVSATISELVEATSEAAQPNAPSEIIDALLEKARKTLNAFAGTSNDPRIVEQRAHTYLMFAEVDFDRGRNERMQEDARVAFAKIDPLAKGDNLEARHLRAQAERLIGVANWGLGNNEEAKLHYDRGIADLNDLLKRNVDPKISWRWMRSQADLYQSLGDVLLFRFDRREEALAAFNKTRELRERLIELGYQGPALEHDLAWITNKRAEVEERLGNLEAALALYNEARERMEALKERILDNPRWATNFGTVQANIGRIKRKQNRYAEAAPVFTRAEETLATVSKRDPKNIDRAATLNWVRFLRTENLARLAIQNNDRIRLLSAREQAQQVIAAEAEIAREPGLRTQALLNKVREEAVLAAIDANLRQLNGNFESAAAGFIEASDIIANGYLKDAAKAPWPDLIRENIEYLEWAGAANVKAQKAAEAQALFKRAMEMLVKYRQAFGDKDFEEFQKRIEARLDRSPSPADRKPPPVERAPPAALSATPADHAPPAIESASPPAPSAAESAPANPTPPATGTISPPPQ